MKRSILILVSVWMAISALAQQQDTIFVMHFKIVNLFEDFTKSKEFEEDSVNIDVVINLQENPYIKIVDDKAAYLYYITEPPKEEETKDSGKFTLFVARRADLDDNDIFMLPEDKRVFLHFISKRYLIVLTNKSIIKRYKKTSYIY
jgi:hypothetical protein